MRAVLIGDGAEFVDGSDESPDEEQVNECDEMGRALRAAVADKSCDGPCAGKDADDEESQDVGGGKFVGFRESINEVGLSKAILSAENHSKARRRAASNVHLPACQEWE